MTPEHGEARHLFFASFQLDCRTGELRRSGNRVKLQAQPARVLVLLATRAGELVSRSEIQESVWGDDTFVDFEQGINFAIKQIRDALGDSAENPCYIETVPRVGYRFIAPTEDPERRGRGPDGGEPSPAPAARSTARSRVVVVAAILGLGITAVAWLYLGRNETTEEKVRTVPLTGFAGAEWWPALSSDGERVAFVWDGGKSGSFDLYVQMVRGGDPLRLTETSGHEYSPAWSPDGAEIAFLRDTTAESDILVIPALGGQERRLGAVAGLDHPSAALNPGLAWSPDGRFLAVSDKASPREPLCLFLLSLESGVKRRFSSEGLDFQPAFSPDGKTLAFARRKSAIDQIYLQAVDEGGARLLATVEGWVTDLDWTADGDAIAFVSGTESQAGTSLWKVSASGGTPERLPFGEMAHTLSIARKGARMVYDRRSWFNTDLWRVDGPASEARGPPQRAIGSSRLDWAQEYSPDGGKVAFVSQRSGNNNIWVCESDGTDCFQITHLERASWPRWSPDSKRLVWQGFEAGAGPHLYISDVEGSYTRRLTGERPPDFLASWSPDGEVIYFTSVRSGEQQIWKMPAEGGEATQVTKKGGQNPRASADGRFVYYIYRLGPSAATIRRVSVDGGEEQNIGDERRIYIASWTLWRNQIVYATGAPQERMGHVESFDLETGEVRRLFSSDAAIGDGITVSPDGRWVLVSLGEPEISDIMLVEGFR